MSNSPDTRMHLCQMACRPSFCAQSTEVVTVTDDLQELGPDFLKPEAIPVLVKAMNLFTSCAAYHDWVTREMDYNDTVTSE